METDKSQASSTQISVFLVNGRMITDKNDIRDMWAGHFEELGPPDLHKDYDNNFAACISGYVANFVQNLPGPSSGRP